MHENFIRISFFKYLLYFIARFIWYSKNKPLWKLMGGTVSRIGFSKSKFKFSSSKSLSGKTVIVTGANTGVGFETALDLAKRNGRIILACRNREKGEVAKSRIIQLTGNTNVVFKQLDMSLMSSIREFVSIISTEEKAVDILINNAGVVS